MPLSEEYLAGLFDGEGHVTVTRNRNSCREYLTVGCGIASTDRAILEEVKQSFGGNVYRTNEPSETRKACYGWVARSGQMTAFLEMMLPHLRIKRRQAELGIEFQKGMGTGKPGAVTEEEAARRERIRVELRSLNAKCRFA